MDASIFDCICDDKKDILKISDTLNDSTIYETKLLQTKMALLNFESQIVEIDDLYKNDAKYEAHLSKVLNLYQDNLKEFKEICTNLEKFDIENKKYITRFKEPFENFRKNVPRNDKKLIAKLNLLENACSKRLLIAKNERSLIIKILEKMMIYLGTRNTCLHYLAGILEDRRELNLFIAGIDCRMDVENKHLPKITKMINSDAIKKYISAYDG